MSSEISQPSHGGKCDGSCDGSNIAPYQDDSLYSIDSDIISITSAVWEKTTEKTSMHLQAWVDYDYDRHKMSSCDDLSSTAQLNLQRAGLLSRLKVAFAIGKLLQHIKASISACSQEELLQICCVDNFVVHTRTTADGEVWEREVIGIDMISPQISLEVISFFFDSNNFFSLEDEGGNLGRDTRVEITKHSPFCCAKQPCQYSVDDKPICYALGVLMEFIFTERCSKGSSVTHDDSELNAQMGDFLRALSISPRLMFCYSPCEPNQPYLQYDSRPAKSASMPSQSQGGGTLSHSARGPISRLVRDLLSCPSGSDCSPPSLDTTVQDMYQLLLDPNKFLFQSKCQLTANSTNMYGRSAETRSLLDAFCRVSNSGQSEAFVISGFSGSGKTRLVQSIMPSIEAANGLTVKKKFEQNSTNQLSLVLSAFDDLCASLADGNANKELLWRSIVSEFGPCIHMLVQTIPNVIRLVPSPEAALSLAEQSIDTRGDVNFFSLCDIIKRFMRALRSMPRPVMLFLDDLQWADSVSLGLVQTVLSDKKGASCLFFVGTYRDNEVAESHILHGFHDWLVALNVPYNTVHLDDLSEENVLCLVSDSLGLLPRLCRPLAQVVSRKTGGNPFFVHTFLRSLADKRLLTYSLREKSWEWDVDEISAENITPNVLYLLSSKMSCLSEKSQTALKVAACFGIKVNISIIEYLTGTEQYSNLLVDISKAVDVGLMCLDTDGSYLKFAHDKVREAAYDLISPSDRGKFHFDIGMALLATFEPKMVETQEEGTNDILLPILNQINHGVPILLHGESQRISIAKLYHRAASQMLQCYNYTSAYELSKTGISLLPDDSWTSQYDLSVNLYLMFSKSAFSNRKIDEAKNALNKVVSRVASLQQKLDAYSLQCSILLSSCAPKEMGSLMTKILAVLKSLGEYIPGDISPTDTKKLVRSVTVKFNRKSDESLLDINRVGSKRHATLMQAYSILVSLAYVAKPKFHPYFAARWAKYTLEHKGSSKYTPTAYATMAVVLCKDINNENVGCGHRIGILSLRLLNNYDAAISELPLVHLLYYGHVGILFEPLQACVDIHRKAYDISQQVGNTSMASLHKQFLVARELHSGTNLMQLKDNLDMDIKMIEHVYAFPMVAMKLRFCYDAVLTLIGEKTPTALPQKNKTPTFDQETGYVLTNMMTSTYLGHYERVKHVFKQWEELSGENNSKAMISFRGLYVHFYYGLSSILLKKKKKNSTSQRGSREITCRWLELLDNAAEYSTWNFGNKAALLHAERLSLSMKNSEAELQYERAISLSRTSKFVHEEGFACELAGCHHERIGNYDTALALYRQADQCYELWGSVVKCHQMKAKINEFNRAKSKANSCNKPALSSSS